MRLFLITALLILTPTVAQAAAPEVQMYGASWCGPCRMVRAAFAKNAVPYRYIDIDTPTGADAYKRARGSSRGIPLVVIGNDKIVGANGPAIGAALLKNRVIKVAANMAGGKGEYGGETARWWQSQFLGMQNRLDTLDRQIAQLEKVAADNVEKEQLERMRDSRETVKASLNQLDNDASRASVPRKYRR